MFKYVILFFFISICHSDPPPSKVNTYHRLVLALRTPITSFFLPKVNQRTSDTTSDTFSEYIRSHNDIFSTKKWVIHKVFALDSNDKELKFCVNEDNEQLTFYPATIARSFQRELKFIWPSFKIEREELYLWESEYNTYGSCIRADPFDYFRKAERLHNQFDIEAILSSLPNQVYNVEELAAIISNNIRFVVYLGCATSDNDIQYLLEVQICYSNRDFLYDCKHRNGRPEGIHDCDTAKLVKFPELPADPTHFLL